MRFRNALAAGSAKPRRKAEKRLGSATVSVSVRSLTPPLQLFDLEGPQLPANVCFRADFVQFGRDNCLKQLIGGDHIDAVERRASESIDRRRQ